MDKELIGTLQFIIERYQGRTKGSVFIPMRDFSWYNEGNGQLVRLQAEGMITKPLYFDNGVEITLTYAGWHFFDEPQSEELSIEGKMHRILASLCSDMSIPNDWFGFDKQEAKEIIRRLQNEGLIEDVKIATGGQGKKPQVVWVDKAHITCKGFVFLEKYGRVTDTPQYELLSRAFISACAAIADNPASYSSFDEDGLNREIRNFLLASLTSFGYLVTDQTQQGWGETYKHAGELDIRINKNGIPVAIYEGLIHKNEKWLYSHIEKAIGKYNRSGCKTVYVVEFSKKTKFGAFWNSEVEKVKKHPELCDIEEQDVGLLGVKKLIGHFKWEEQLGVFHFIGVNCHVDRVPQIG